MVLARKNAGLVRQLTGFLNKSIEDVAPLLIRYNLRFICTGLVFTKNEIMLLCNHKI